MLHIPILRRGRFYRSLDTVAVPHYRTGEPFVEISQANAGLIRRDLLDQRTPREALAALPASRLLEICRQAGEHFMSATLPLGDGRQSPQDYVSQLSSTTGLPHTLVRRNMEKIQSVFLRMEEIVNGLTRRLDLRVLDEGWTETEEGLLSFTPSAESLGVVLPSNSPGVHSLWIPAIALKIPLVLKPGSAEPWTPHRIAQALIKAGCPAEALSCYSSDHAGSGEILRRCGRSLLFGDTASTGRWAGDPRIEIHGPGYSKIVIGEDCIDDWESYLDVLVRSVADNSGRSCVNASGIWVPRHGEAIARALVERLAGIQPLPEDHPEAKLAAFSDPAVAARISTLIDRDLAVPGARDLSAELRGTSRRVEQGRCAYLLPTIVRCDSPEHPLANREFLFPFASVLEIDQEELPEVLGHSLAVTAITSDRNLIRRLVTSPLVDRLNLGPIPTNQVVWDQPHEGNLFDHLYGRRAIQLVEGYAG